MDEQVDMSSLAAKPLDSDMVGMRERNEARESRENALARVLPPWLMEDKNGRKRFYVVLPWYQWVPAVNLVYDFLFDKAPDVERVKDILSTFGLVNALLLAVVMAIPGSVSYDELTAANVRYGIGINVQREAVVDFQNHTTVNPAYVKFTKQEIAHDWFAALLNKGPTLYHQFGSDDNFGYSNRLGFYIAGAVGSLTSALLSVVLTFFFMAASDFHHLTSFDAWWFYARWLVAHQFISTAWGVVLTYFTLMMLMDIKFPDYCDYRDTPSPSNKRYFGARGVSALQPQCPRSYFFWSTVLVLWVTIAVCLTIMSLASTSRYYHEATDEVAVQAVAEEQLKRTTSIKSPPSSPRASAPAEASPRANGQQVDANMLKLLSTMQETLEALTRQVASSSAVRF